MSESFQLFCHFTLISPISFLHSIDLNSEVPNSSKKRSHTSLFSDQTYLTDVLVTSVVQLPPRALIFPSDLVLGLIDFFLESRLTLSVVLVLYFTLLVYYSEFPQKCVTTSSRPVVSPTSPGDPLFFYDQKGGMKHHTPHPPSPYVPFVKTVPSHLKSFPVLLFPSKSLIILFHLLK